VEAILSTFTIETTASVFPIGSKDWKNY
jgi:hypothetical protein